VSARLGVPRRYDDQMAHPGSDLVITARTAIRLEGLVRLDAAHLDGCVIVCKLVCKLVWGHHCSAEDGPRHEGNDHDERGGNDGDVAAVVHA
jgi:hypothetical protein